MVDLVRMEALYFDGDDGETLRREDIPPELLEEAAAKREDLLEAVSMFSDTLMEALLEGKDVNEEMIVSAVRSGTTSQQLTPVFLGSAYRNGINCVTTLSPNPPDSSAVNAANTSVRSGVPCCMK